MLAVVKPGGFVVTRHVRAEGVHQAYSGFHQWNFDLEDGRSVLWNKAGKHDVARGGGRLRDHRGLQGPRRRRRLSRLRRAESWTLLGQVPEPAPSTTEPLSVPWSDGHGQGETKLALVL